jgi:hypothetical protein
MQCVVLQSHIAEDGVLHLDVPMDMSNTDVQITVMVRPIKKFIRNHTESKRRFEKLRQKYRGRIFSDSVELLREDRQR